MTTAILTTIGQPLELAELTIPSDAPSYGQVQVRVTATGICGAQLQEIDGHKAGGPLPHPLGHEGVGIVEAIGIGVTTVAVGDKAVLHWRKGDGIESDFPRYLMHGRSDFITGGKVTTFMQQTVVSENRCTAVPHDTPDELCALLGCSLSTALGTIEHEAKLLMGESVLIIGCGGLGLNLILAAKMRGASIICAHDREDKDQITWELGATIFSRSGLFSQQFDVIIDTTGNPEAIENDLKYLAPSGRFVMVGQPKEGEFIRIPSARNLFNGSGCSIMATQGGRFQPAQDIPRYVAAWRSGHLKIDGIITHRMTLSEINQAIALVRAGQAGRVLILP